MVWDLATFTIQGCKIAAQIEVSFRQILTFWAGFFLYLFCILYFLTPFNGLFAPTSQTTMSKLFRFSELLGKINGKKWSQIWKLLLITGVKSQRQKSFKGFFCFICSLRLNVFVPPLPEFQCPNFLDFRSPLGKLMERIDLRFENFCLKRV